MPPKKPKQPPARTASARATRERSASFAPASDDDSGDDSAGTAEYRKPNLRPRKGNRVYNDEERFHMMEVKAQASGHAEDQARDDKRRGKVGKRQARAVSRMVDATTQTEAPRCCLHGDVAAVSTLANALPNAAPPDAPPDAQSSVRPPDSLPPLAGSSDTAPEVSNAQSTGGGPDCPHDDGGWFQLVPDEDASTRQLQINERDQVSVCSTSGLESATTTDKARIAELDAADTKHGQRIAELEAAVKAAEMRDAEHLAALDKAKERFAELEGDVIREKKRIAQLEAEFAQARDETIVKGVDTNELVKQEVLVGLGNGPEVEVLETDVLDKQETEGLQDEAEVDDLVAEEFDVAQELNPAEGVNTVPNGDEVANGGIEGLDDISDDSDDEVFYDALEELPDEEVDNTTPSISPASPGVAKRRASSAPPGLRAAKAMFRAAK
ncbi:hypothetical protein Q8F55_008446 [Vanrija albida]|uniref:Uncharacterized protein n=1 Tax=Vanrija albida TaxID=181172 RepID=A0ABR3PR77_9TREE